MESSHEEAKDAGSPRRNQFRRYAEQSPLKRTVALIGVIGWSEVGASIGFIAACPEENRLEESEIQSLWNSGNRLPDRESSSAELLAQEFDGLFPGQSFES